MEVTPPWFGNNLILLLYKIFYYSLLLGGGCVKLRTLNTFSQCIFHIKYLLFAYPSLPICNICSAGEALHAPTGSVRQTSASPVF